MNIFVKATLDKAILIGVVSCFLLGCNTETTTTSEPIRSDTDTQNLHADIQPKVDITSLDTLPIEAV